jgi:hypothetical protein
MPEDTPLPTCPLDRRLIGARVAAADGDPEASTRHDVIEGGGLGLMCQRRWVVFDDSKVLAIVSPLVLRLPTMVPMRNFASSLSRAAALASVSDRTGARLHADVLSDARSTLPCFIVGATVPRRHMKVGRQL